MKLSEKKKFFRDLCRTIGHTDTKGKCSRCQKRFPFVIWEMVGMVVHNAKGITKINIDP